MAMPDRDQMRRAWCGRCAYPDRQPFVFGTVLLDLHAGEREAISALQDAWAEISPHPAPNIQPVPGVIFFREES
jgi:hypothetical protein